MSKFKLYLESISSTQKKSVVKIVSPFDSGYQEKVKQDQDLKQYGNVNYLQSGNKEITKVYCNNLQNCIKLIKYLVNARKNQEYLENQIEKISLFYDGDVTLDSLDWKE